MPDKLYLKCVNCGEVFDEIETAYSHFLNDKEFDCQGADEGFEIVAESEAF